MKALRRVLSALVVFALFVVGGFALSALTSGSIAAARQPNPTLDDLINAGGTVIAWLLFGYLALGALLALLAALPGAAGEMFSAVSERVTPRAYRRVAQMALGLTVVAGPAMGTVAAQAAPSDAHVAGQTSASASYQTNRLDLDLPGVASSATTRLDLDLPGRATSSPADHLDLDLPGHPSGSTGTADGAGGGRGAVNRPATNDPLLRPARAHVRTGDQAHRAGRTTSHTDIRGHASRAERAVSYTVKRGDCLWNIAKAHLPDGASDAQIDAEWHRWYAANRQTIGDNPNLIYPGQVFHAPAS